MPLSLRLALLTALMSILLVLGATEVALRWSERSRLDDLRDESAALAGSWAAYLSKAAPTGSATALRQALANWPGQHISTTSAWVYLPQGDHWTLAAASDSGMPHRLTESDRRAYARRSTEVWLEDGAWNVATPFGGRHTAGVLHVQVSVRRMRAWDRIERQRAYTLAGVAALLVATFVGVLTARWVGRPLAELGAAMSLAHGGAEGAPPAPERGAEEFRVLARRYNELRTALARRERESEARGALLALEERARAFDRLALMEETASTFAHEIGTPLNTVSGHLQLLRDDLAHHGGGRRADASALERVNLLQAQIERLAGIVRTQLGRGTWPRPAPGASELGAVAERMLRFLEPSLADGGVVADLVRGTGPTVARSDPALVEQILLNLLKNAIEALPPGGHVTLTVAGDATAGLTWLDVADDGPGIAPEARQQLFNPFATTKGASGTGLGLAVSRRLARSLGGDLVHVPSERGTAWRLTLPAAEVVHD